MPLVLNNVLDQYVDSLDDLERKALYDLFVSSDRGPIRGKLLAIEDWYARSVNVH